MSQRVEQGKVSHHGEKKAGQHDWLAADLVREPPKKDEPRSRQNEGDCNQNVGRCAVDVQVPFQKKQRVKLAGVPHYCLTHDGAEQGDQYNLQIAPLTKGFLERCLRRGSQGLHFDEYRTLSEFQPDP